MTEVPRLTAGTFSIPQLGLGTWQSEKEAVREAVKCAIKTGYRHIDCAYCYENEKEVGEAIKHSIESGLVKREELFITSKLWSTHHRNVDKGVRESLKNLGLDYLDLFLIHFPVPLKLREDGELYPYDPTTGFTMELDVEEPKVTIESTWKEMEKIVESGLVKNIGLSNFTVEQIKRILQCSNIKPVNLQCEHHPYLQNLELKKFCRENNITFTAYSPLGAPNSIMRDADQPRLVKDDIVVKMAKKHNTTSQTILLKWSVQHGVAVIPKSVTPSYIIENYKIFQSPTLTNEEMKQLDNLTTLRGTFRTCFLVPFGLGEEFPWKQELTKEFWAMVSAMTG